VRDPKARSRKRYDGTASRVISIGVFVALEALPFQIISDLKARPLLRIRYGGDLGEGGFHIGASQNETSLWPSANFRFQHVSVSGSGEPLNVSTAYPFNIFFGPLQRFNDSTNHDSEAKCSSNHSP
jgi:hypothetical protein